MCVLGSCRSVAGDDLLEVMVQPSSRNGVHVVWPHALGHFTERVVDICVRNPKDDAGERPYGGDVSWEVRRDFRGEVWVRRDYRYPLR